MDDEFHISEAVPKDAEAIRELAITIWNASYPGIISQEQIDYMLNWMYSPERIRCEMQEEEIAYLRADGENGMLGFGAFGPGEETGDVFLHKLYVDPQSQGRGIGSALIRVMEVRCRSRGDCRISLRVNRENHQAIAAYEKWGFRKISEVCSDIGGGFVMDDFVMLKSLA